MEIIKAKLKDSFVDVFVDSEDFPLLNRFNWYIDTTGYPATSFRENWTKHDIRMHKLIMGAGFKGTQIDHIDRNKLNNTKNNLRFVKPLHNLMNKEPYKNKSSKYKGVFKKKNRFLAQIHKDGKKYHLGSFENEADAALAYNQKAYELFGDIAYQNKI